MADKSKKKEKHRLKREKKRHAARKVNSYSTLSLLRRGEGELHCLVTKNWEKEGIAGLYVLGAAGGRSVMACFLIDAWCVGLKDAWGEQNVTRIEFNDLLKRVSAKTPLVEIEDGEAAALVKAAVYFSGKNGFTLPGGWAKWAAVFGPMDFDDDVDLSRFGKDGKILYIGSASFLRRRLKGSTLEQFIARPDVDFVFRIDPDMASVQEMDDDDYEVFESDGDDDDETTAEVDEIASQVTPRMAPLLQMAVEEMTNKVLDELHRRHIAPHPRLEDAIFYVASISVTGMALSAVGITPPDREQQEDAMNDLMTKNREADRLSLWEAIQQVMDASDLTVGPAPSAMPHFPPA